MEPSVGTRDVYKPTTAAITGLTDKNSSIAPRMNDYHTALSPLRHRISTPCFAPNDPKPLHLQRRRHLNHRTSRSLSRSRLVTLTQVSASRITRPTRTLLLGHAGQRHTATLAGTPTWRYSAAAMAALNRHAANPCWSSPTYIYGRVNVHQNANLHRHHRRQTPRSANRPPATASPSIRP